MNFGRFDVPSRQRNALTQIITEITVPKIVNLLLRPDKLDISYDEKSDVLYISVGKPKEADD